VRRRRRRRLRPRDDRGGADDSDADPAAFVAVTLERIVEPTSSEVTA
jgi:hypothetical protein